jgi:aldehyde dehydrogenase
VAVFAAPGQPDSVMSYQPRYDNWIGGEYVRPVRGGYRPDTSPVTGEVFTEVASSTGPDLELAVRAARAAAPGWAGTSPAERATVLHRVADRIEQSLQLLAVAETWESGRPIRETLNADLPLAIDQWRACAGAVRAQQGGISEIDQATVAYHLREPLGVVGLLVGSDFPLLMASWQLAPALAAGNAVILTASEQTPASIHVLLGLIHDLLPAGVVNVVNGIAGKTLAAATAVVPATPNLAGRIPNVFFSDALLSDDDFQQKALEGFTMFALNQGSTGARLSAALIEKPIYDEFLELATIRTKAIQQGNPLDTETMVGAQPSVEQLATTLSLVDAKKAAGARVVVGGERAELPGTLAGGFYVQPTIFEVGADIRPFRQDSCGPVVTVGMFSQVDDAVRIANDSFDGTGAALWTRDIDRAYRAGRQLRAGRIWTNCYHRYPAHAALGGRQAQGGDGRTQLLEQYQQTKDLLVSYDSRPLGLF